MVIFWSFCDVITPIFDELFTITRKINIGEVFYYFSHTIQHTPHHPWKPYQNWRGGIGVCISLIGKNPSPQYHSPMLFKGFHQGGSQLGPSWCREIQVFQTALCLIVKIIIRLVPRLIQKLLLIKKYYYYHNYSNVSRSLSSVVREASVTLIK